MKLFASAHILAAEHGGALERLNVQYKIMKKILNMGRKTQEDEDDKSPHIFLNYKVIHFCKFCQISDQMNNYSIEVFQFYIKMYVMLIDTKSLLDVD